MILTAIEIDNNRKTIDKQVDDAVKIKIKKRLSKEVSELRKQKALNLIEGEEKPIVTSEEKEEIKLRLLNDEETQHEIIIQRDYITKKTENYYLMRETLQDLNELNEFSAEIERNELQTIDKFKTYEELIQLNTQLTDKFFKYMNIRKQNIDKYLTTYKNKQLTFTDDSCRLIKNMHELYTFDKEMDDIDLFDKFNMETNIDMSNKLADYYLNKVVNEDSLYDNCINETTDSSTDINQIVKTNIVSNKHLALLLLSNYGTGRTSFVSNNSVTCLTNTYETTHSNEYIYVQRTIGELLLEITNPKLANLSKEERKQIYTTTNGSRPSGDQYYLWDGLQIFDIDLKEWEQVGYINILKKKMFEYLCDFHWFLWIAKSASGRGLHIYTKVTPPHHVYTDIRDNDYICKYWFKVNYNHKSSIIYDVLYRIHTDNNNQLRFTNSNFRDDFELKFLDNVVNRITAGIRLTYDNQVMVNHSFLDLHPAIGLSQTIDGFNHKQSIDSVLLRDTKYNKESIAKINTEYRVDKFEAKTTGDEIDLTKFDFANDLSEFVVVPKQSINYNVRFHVCNTLASLFGKDGLPIAHRLLQSDICKNVGEINSFYSCAISNRKKPSKLGLDILKKHGIIKQVKEEIKQYTDNIFKNGIVTAIENSLVNQLQKPTIELTPYEYLSDKLDILLNPMAGGFTNSAINILLSPPGSGKTHLLLELAKQGKRILLVEPFVSVIKNKVESDEQLMEIFDVYYDGKNLNDAERGINAISTFDKFSKCNYEKISSMFDYICIDESHLLFTSSYRIEATSNAVRKIKELFYISSNDPFSAKIIMMTGTETGDSYFFGESANIIRVAKKSLSKQLEFLICDDVLDCITRLSFKAFTLINEGYRLIIPTNKGEIYSQKLIGMVEYLLERPCKYGYYKSSNKEQEICQLINNKNTVGDYEIVFCSNYLSVGVDIIDKHKFASLYFGPFSGYEIEQFNARIRKTGIKSIYCIQTEKNDGTTNDLLIEEPNMVLKLTEEDIENFLDDKEIASAKQEFIAQYDPVLQKITTPGFSYLHGAIRFNQEEYELISFETKFLEVMVHPVKVARELSKYGYSITVSDQYDGLPEEKQEELKKIGIESAKNEKQRKHTLYVGTFIDLIDTNNHVTDEGLEFNNLIDWIGKNKDCVYEDREQQQFVLPLFNLMGSPVKVTVKSREALDRMYMFAKFAITKYSVIRAKELINQYIDDNGMLKLKAFSRAIHLLKLIDKADNNELTAPTLKILEKMYDWLDTFSVNKNYRISHNTYVAELDSWTNSYIDMLKIKIKTTYGYEKIKDNIIEMLNDLSCKNMTKEGIRFDYNKLPEANSNNEKYRKSVDTMVENMFKITSENTSLNNRPKNTHIILTEQPFSVPQISDDTDDIS